MTTPPDPRGPAAVPPSRPASGPAQRQMPPRPLPGPAGAGAGPGSEPGAPSGERRIPRHDDPTRYGDWEIGGRCIDF